MGKKSEQNKSSLVSTELRGVRHEIETGAQVSKRALPRFSFIWHLIFFPNSNLYYRTDSLDVGRSSEFLKIN